MSHAKRLVCVLLCGLLVVLAAAACSTGTSEKKQTAQPFTAKELKFIKNATKVNTLIRSQWNSVARIVKANGNNVANLNTTEHALIQKHFDAAFRLAHQGGMDSPSYRFNKAMHLWDTCRNGYNDVTNAMVGVVSDPTAATKAKLNRQLKKLRKETDAYKREARRLLKAAYPQS